MIRSARKANSREIEVAWPRPSRPPRDWPQLLVRTREDARRAIDRVIDELSAENYPLRDRFAVQLALEEAIVNSLKHGHGYDPAKVVRVRYLVTTDRVVAAIEDEGPGFDPQEVPNPLEPENLQRPSGRGLLLMRQFMTWVRYNDRGTRVTLCKCRSAEDGEW